MNNSCSLKAKLVSLRKIRALVFSSFNDGNSPKFILKRDDGAQETLKVVKYTSSPVMKFYELEMGQDFVFGHAYVLSLEGYPVVNIEVNEATTFKEFDSLFNYDGDDLGAIYNKKETSFNLWAPLASSVILKLEKEDNEFIYVPLKRTEKGVYRTVIKGDLLNKKYLYLVTNSGVTLSSLDPWGKGVSLNSEYSAVVDTTYIKNIKSIKPNNKLDNPVDYIIYETHIRDFTEDKSTDIVNKGKYLGMVEENRHTIGGNPAGLDYLQFLGITHLQILPVIDYLGVDDIDPSKGYNWGYNPISFFALEGSYSTHPEIPMNRLIEFKTMVNKLHSHNIRIIMDVVYNHIYEFMDSAFEKVVPNYFYRRRNNGQIAAASGCGDDVASEKYMVRKTIIESLKYFTEVFDIDGYRFDLMGLLDIKTINDSLKECQKIKKDIYFYGEGWNMGMELAFENKACSENADKLPEIGFFNDLYRDTLKGPHYHDQLTKKGYVGGNNELSDLAAYCFYGSTLNINHIARFKEANQSINYVECHDNCTLFDKLIRSNSNEDESTILKRVMLANSLIMNSYGVPLFHMGQEIGQSKSELDNTYKTPTINNMNWALVDERFEMASQFHLLANLRKTKLHHIFSYYTQEDIKNIFTYDKWWNGVLCFYSDKQEYIAPYKKIIFLVNPSNQSLTYDLDDYYSLLSFDDKISEQTHIKSGMIAPLTAQGLFLK